MDVQQLFKNLKKEEECPLCLETVKNPKTLPCLHSFCLVCLDKLAGFARRQLQTTIKCPVCQTSFQIPEGDTFNNLPTSFHLNRLVDVFALMAVHRHRNAAVVMRTTPQHVTVSCARTFSAQLALTLINACRLQEVIAMFSSANCKCKMSRS